MAAALMMLTNEPLLQDMWKFVQRQITYIPANHT